MHLRNGTEKEGRICYWPAKKLLFLLLVITLFCLGILEQNFQLEFGFLHF